MESGEFDKIFGVMFVTPAALWKLICAISESPFKIGQLVAGFEGFNQRLSN